MKLKNFFLIVLSVLIYSTFSNPLFAQTTVSAYDRSGLFSYGPSIQYTKINFSGGSSSYAAGAGFSLNFNMMQDKANQNTNFGMSILLFPSISAGTADGLQPGALSLSTGVTFSFLNGLASAGVAFDLFKVPFNGANVDWIGTNSFRNYIALILSLNISVATIKPTYAASEYEARMLQRNCPFLTLCF